MRFPRPRSLNGLILVGFSLVALPLLLAVIWALFNLDRLTGQSERLVSTGAQTATLNRELTESVITLERVSRQHAILQNTDSQELLRSDLASLERHLDAMLPLAQMVAATDQLESIRLRARRVVDTFAADSLSAAQVESGLAQFVPMRDEVATLTDDLSTYVESELSALQDSMRRAQQVSAWQVAALVPGTLILVLIFTLLVARPIRQIDKAINQLGHSGFSKPIEIEGPTDLKKLGRQLEWLRQRLLELAQEKNRFLRHMSHELKTPLANIREGTELMMDGTLGELDPAQREVTDILRANGLKLQQLIENLLSFSAWQTKNEVLTKSDFPLRKLIVNVAKEQRLALKAAHIQLRLDIEDVVVTADRDKIRTVLDNLLSNAIKFTPKGGHVTIRAKRETDRFVLEFADTGPGIPADERPRIFDAFFQGRREQGGQVAGTGIGLSVVLECIQAHDGSVEILDSHEFSGAHFRIQVPQQRIEQPQRLAANG